MNLAKRATVSKSGICSLGDVIFLLLCRYRFLGQTPLDDQSKGDDHNDGSQMREV
ncbi:hypothetical protein C8Q75DRAFT_771053, partial [Abortiporus biennis]